MKQPVWMILSTTTSALAGFLIGAIIGIAIIALAAFAFFSCGFLPG